MRRFVMFSAVVVASLVAINAWGTVPYVVTDLGALGGTSSAAYGINNSGQVAGWAYVSGNATWHAFRTEANQPINPATDDLGALNATSNSSYAAAINNSGQIAGYSDTGTVDSFGDHVMHAVSYSGSGPMHNLDLRTASGTFSNAYGINDSGQVVGFYAWTVGSSATWHAFRTPANGSINPATDDLGTLGGSYSFAYGINNSGQVVGNAFTSGDAAAHAFRTEANQPINPNTDDLGTLGGSYSSAYGINNSGQVVGYSYTGGGFEHAFLFSGSGPMTDLGTLGGTNGGVVGSVANGINGIGQVVGYSYTSGGAQHAFLENGGGTMQDLNDLIGSASGWTLVNATGINDSGQIVGYGTNANGQTDAFLITPVPEPSALILLGVGLLGYGWRKRTR